MIVENPEAFKAWMISVLEPLCDADPVALAKYVYALVKKDKPTDELRDSMISQLEVFLQKETKGFVDFLFTKLELGLEDEYTYFVKVKEEPLEALDVSVPVPTSAEEALLLEETINTSEDKEGSNEEPVENNLSNVSSIPFEDHETEQQQQESKEQVAPQNPRLRNGSFSGTSKTLDRQTSSSRSRDRKSDSERDEKDRSYSVRRRNSSGSPPRRQERSRSRSWETHRRNRRSRSRSRRSRSRGRDRSRAWRNKSPPRRYDRKLRSWSRSPGRSHSRSPPPKSRYTRYRNRSPFIRSPTPHGASLIDSPTKSSDATPIIDLNHGDDLNLSQLSQNSLIQSVVNVKEHVASRGRCRSYEEEGLCLVGDNCPFDHGKDPVVLEDIGQVLSFSTPRASYLEPPSPAMGMPMLHPAITPGMALLHPPQIMNRTPPNLSEYNPDAPSMEPRIWSKQPFRNTGRGMMRPGGHQQRELINVPTDGANEPFYSPTTLGNSNKRQCPPEFSNESDMMPPYTKQRFDYGRLGPRKGNCSLHLKKIPPGLNDIAHLHNHFVKFGKIVNIQVNFEGDLEAALITFTSHAEASAAYKCTEAVLKNRFIKVFWHNPEKDDKQENISPAVNRPSAKDRLGVPVSLMPASSIHKENIGNEKIKVTGGNITKTFYNAPDPKKRRTVQRMESMEDRKVIITTKVPQMSQELIKAREDLKKKRDEIRQEAITKTLELSQRKRDFLDKLLLRHCELTDKLEKGNVTVEQKAEILTAIKELQESIDMFRKDIASPVPTKPGTSATQQYVNVTPQSVKESIEQTKKEILDAELDLMTKQQQGKDASELSKTINDLKTKAHYLGKLAKKNITQHRLSRGGLHSNRSLSYGGRGGFNPHSTVDHRPTKLLVSGFESDDKADVLEHFSKFGEVADHVWDEATPALVIQFKTRKDAETAMAKGRNFQDRLMSVTWFIPAQSMGMRNPGKRPVMLLNENVGELLPDHDEEEEALRINIDAAEDLLLQDEEEEEIEDEVRSWRR